MENRSNPYLDQAEKKVAEMAEKEFWEKRNNFDYTELAFTRLNEFCNKVKATPSKLIQESRLHKFAASYSTWMQNDPKYTIQIERVEGWSAYEDGAYIYLSLYGIEEWEKDTKISYSNVWENNTTIFYGSWTPIHDGFSVVCKPWERVHWGFVPYENIEWLPDKRLELRTVVIFPAVTKDIAFDGKWVEQSDGCVQISFDQITLRIYYTIFGKSLQEMVNEVFGK